ncbi:hypothetical protein VNO80_22815 [Phaseolus coccineus]|uniref:Dienelactone hydrolase domain-containing protein n=1 Tax=Phaseolus coccineus TaxID=3886 RepID=A0AAN9M8M9_PHACN
MHGSDRDKLLNASSGAGHVTNIGGLNSYVTGSPLAIFAILLVSDVFGYKAPLFRKLADKVAAAGFYVVAPDFFYDDPFDPDNVTRPLPVWLQDHEPEKGKTAIDVGKSKHVEAAVLLHPAYVEVNDIRGIKIPIAILGGQNDTITPPKLIKQFKQVLQDAKPKVAYEVKNFPNVGHGWTVRYDPNDPKAVKAADKAHRIMIDWFDKHLKD